MGRCVFFFCSLVILLILTGFGFRAPNNRVPESLRVTQPTECLFPQQLAVFTSNLKAPPFLGTSYVGFKEALAFKESQGNYFIMNTLGYLGKYQFGIGTLQLMGVYNTTRFLNDPELRRKYFTPICRETNGFCARISNDSSARTSPVWKLPSRGCWPRRIWPVRATLRSTCVHGVK